MSPEESEMLKRALALSEENNQMLHAMRRGMMWSRVMSILYWVFIVGSAVGAFILIQPYIASIQNLTNSIGGDNNQNTTTSNPYDLKSVINNLKGITQ